MSKGYTVAGRRTSIGLREASTWSRGATGRERIAFHIVAGFLGAGKTTLINRLLRAPELADGLVIKGLVALAGWPDAPDLAALAENPLAPRAGGLPG